MTREKIVAAISGGDDLTIEDAENFCRIMHADAAIGYCNGIVRICAVRQREVG